MSYDNWKLCSDLDEYPCDEPWTDPSPEEEAADAIEDHRSRARSAWHQARQLRKFAREHDWHMSDDDVQASLGMAADLRRETYEHLVAAKSIEARMS